MKPKPDQPPAEDSAFTAATCSAPLFARCGDCDHWMKKSLCPREHGFETKRGGPSMSGLPCDKWKPSDYYTKQNREKTP